jgi:hypothetical protein
MRERLLRWRERRSDAPDLTPGQIPLAWTKRDGDIVLALALRESHQIDALAPNKFLDVANERLEAQALRPKHPLLPGHPPSLKTTSGSAKV